MTVEPGSVGFDRAAAYYDETRGLSREGAERTTRLLADELRSRGLVLEVGVGTGQLALPLHALGIPVVGIDLAMPMMARLVAKAGGSPPFPLAQADATRLPFADAAFGAAYLRWVLHLIPGWTSALAEIARVVRPGGVFLAQLGAYPEGPMAEIQARFLEVAGTPPKPEGLDWGDRDALDDAMASLGAAGRALPGFVSGGPPGATIESFLRGVEDNRYSWTWRVPDDETRARAAGEARRFAEERYGDLSAAAVGEFEVVWHAYDL